MRYRHVRRPRVAREAAHEDDAPPVHLDHGGEKLTENPDLAHQINLSNVDRLVNISEICQE